MSNCAPETVSYEMLIGLISFHLNTTCQDPPYCHQLLEQLHELNRELKDSLKKQHQKPRES